MPLRAMRRMRDNLNADCPLVRALYHVIVADELDDDAEDAQEEVSHKEGVLGRHYALIAELRQCAERELTARVG